MRSIQSICGIFLYFCFISTLHAEDDFLKFEENLISEPPGYGQTSDEVMIYSKVSDKTTKKAIEEQFNTLQKRESENSLENNSLENTSLENSYLKKSDSKTSRHYLKFDEDNIKVYLFSHKSSKVATFKAITYIKSTLDSILAVMFDNPVCMQWIYSCGQAFVLENVSFVERYHYQTFKIPFPFTDRDFIFHSTISQNPKSKSVNITMSSAPDYCNDKQSDLCNKVNQSEMVRVRKSIGTYKLEPDDSRGTKITWIQHTDPEGNIPSWLVNQFAADTPFWTFKNLVEMVKQEKYKQAKLIYNSDGMAVALDIPVQELSVPKLTKVSSDIK